jgi:hypothetical protein
MTPDDAAVAGDKRDPEGGHPLSRLDAADRDLVLEFVLCSGSLKALAKARGVSYPTIRARLDRLIERLRALVEGKPLDPLSETLADLVERGELSTRGAKRILDAARRARSGDNPTNERTSDDALV